MKPTARIDKIEFLYFRVHDEDIRQLGQNTFLALMDKGTMTLNDLFEDTLYINTEIIENLNDIPSELIDKNRNINNPVDHLNVEWV